MNSEFMFSKKNRRESISEVILGFESFSRSISVKRAELID
jgi:hypothetical protein